MNTMRNFILLITAAAGVAIATAPAQEINRAIRLRPDSGVVSEGQVLTIYFPDAIVAADAIGREGSQAPVGFQPDLAFEFTWKSQSEGQLRVTEQPVPGQAYTVGLTQGLRDAAGALVDREQWIDRRFEAPPLTVSSRFRNRDGSLPQKPTVSLMSNYPIRFADAARTVYFQDRDTRERFETEVLLPGLNAKPAPDEPAAPEVGSSWLAEPKSALPAGRTVDLVVDGLTDAATGTALNFVKSFPLGDTKPLALDQAHASHPVLDKPTIDLHFNQQIDPESMGDDAIRVEPQVEGFKALPTRNWVRLEGEFDPAGSYTVHLAQSLRGRSGYQMADAVVERVEFGKVTPSIYLPRTQYFTRSGLGLNLKFLHANTRAATWHLAPLPEHKIGVARSRLSQDEERLIEQLSLQPVASGTTPAAPSIDGAFRDVTIAGPIPSGAYLFEVSANTPSGKLAANRAIVFFNDVFVTQKQTHDQLWAKVSAMGDSEPVAGARVRLVTGDNRLLETRATDDQGVVTFPRDHLTRTRNEDRAGHMLIDAPGGGTAVVFTSTSRFYNSGYTRNRPTDPQPVGTVFADRNLYRPGTTAKYKGILRLRGRDNKLRVAQGASVNWEITQGYRGKAVAQGTATTDDFGGWEAEWQTPKDIKLGGYWLTANHAGKRAANCFVRVEEYRVPLFEVALTAEHEQPSDTVRIRVQSNYFHGGPNASALARWQLHWDEAYVGVRGGHADDRFSEKPLSLPPLTSSSGELRLDERGLGWIEVPIPEDAPRSRPRYSFGLDVDVVSAEGQTITDGFYGKLQPTESVLGVRLDPDYELDQPRLALRLTAVDPKDKPAHGMPVEARVFRIEARTVKEQVGDGLFRYRNFDEHIPVANVVASVPEEEEPLLVDIGGQPGRYVVTAQIVGGGAPRASTTTIVAGEAPAPYPVYDDQTFEIAADKEDYYPGDTAALALEAPFGGKAWVSLETDEILEQFVVDLDHNASRIDLPIKPEHFPNVYATVYLVRSGGPDRLPAERFGRVRLEVRRPDLHLDVKPLLTQSSFEPGQTVSGEVFVSAGSNPVPNADITVFAVDEAVLKLGDWKLPEIFGRFYPARGHRVSTGHALDNHHIEFSEDEVAEKGFLIGGGGPGEGQRRKKPRENFLARACWKTGLRTDADGKVKFDFVAPDNLTEFRVTAVAMTTDHRFGDGTAEFQINKRLMVEPALPRFVRAGDEVVLRAVARQTPMDEARVLIKCSTSEGLEILGEPTAEIGPLAKDIPGAFGVRARVKSGVSEVKVRFDASIAGHSDITDEVEETLPVHHPGIMQRTGLYGKIPDGANEFVLAKVAPEFWPRTEGEFGLTLSRTPFLPKLQALPEVLEYPHGCFEQRASRLLAYTQLAGLLAYLPELGERHKNYRQRVEQGLRYFASHQRADGFLSYWSGSRDPNPYVTAQAAWVAAEAAKLGYSVPEKLSEGFGKALDDIIRARVDCSDNTRAFALFVQSRITPRNAPADVIEELHLQRDRIGDEARAFLALAMHGYDIMPGERQLLVREIDNAPDNGGFNPRNFYSPTRAKAVAYVAQTKIADPRWTRELEPKVRGSLFGMLDDSRNLSTQENIWLLMAMVALLDSEGYQQLPVGDTGAEYASPNGFSLAWRRRALAAIGEIGFKVDDQPTYYLVDATVMRDATNTKREDRGLRVERVVTNLTDPSRKGTAESPHRLGDELLINFRLQSDRRHHYIALVDELPAGLETVNFNLAQVAQFYRLPEGAERNSLRLDHSELRDRSANLYFNRLPEGSHNYSILARVTSAGRFAWPATDVTPMYEPRFGALGGADVVFASDE